VARGKRQEAKPIKHLINLLIFLIIPLQKLFFHVWVLGVFIGNDEEALKGI